MLGVVDPHWGGDVGGDSAQRGGGAQYEVPYNPDAEAAGPGSIFASGIWVAGLLDGNPDNLRFAGSTYNNWEFWPGPLDAVRTDPSMWTKALAALRRHSLIRTDAEGLSVHRLVQAVTLDG